MLGSTDEMIGMKLGHLHTSAVVLVLPQIGWLPVHKHQRPLIRFIPLRSKMMKLLKNLLIGQKHRHKLFVNLLQANYVSIRLNDHFKDLSVS